MRDDLAELTDDPNRDRELDRVVEAAALVDGDFIVLSQRVERLGRVGRGGDVSGGGRVRGLGRLARGRDGRRRAWLDRLLRLRLLRR